MGRLLTVASLGLLLLGCGEPKLNSGWLDREVDIDGSHLEWEGAVYSVDDLAGSIGLLNDDANLYLCLATTDQDLMRQILGPGLTAWFDPAGGKEKVFGIRFPLGVSGVGLFGERGGERPDPERLRVRLDESEPEMEILRGEEQATRMFAAQAAGIDLKIDETNGALVYELLLPLRTDTGKPFAIGSAPGRTIGIGLETPEIERPRMRGRGRSGGVPGGRGGGVPGGGRGGMMGGRPRPEPPSRLNVWLEVNLSEGPTATEP
jgi:hypothetical protein